MTIASDKENRPLILIVDDDLTQRVILREFLQAKGFAVGESDNARACLEAIAASNPVLVISDIIMPGMSGTEMLSEIRREHDRADLPVIMITGQDEPSQIVEALRLGANDYITKPFEFDVAEARIRTHLALRESRAELRSSEERYALVIAGSNDGIWDWDLRSDEIFFSARWKELLGFAANEGEDTPDLWFDRIHAEDLGMVKREIQKHIEGVTLHLDCEYRMRHRNYTYRWVRTRGTSLRDESGRAYRLAGTQVDITESKVVDPLTGLPNRALFIERVNNALDRMSAHQDQYFAVLLTRISNWNAIKQSYGQSFCDRVLIETAQRIVTVTHAKNTLGTLGENLFGLLLEDTSEALHAVDTFMRLRELVRQPLILDGEEIRPDMAAGIVLGDTSQESGDEVVHAAAIALNSADADTAVKSYEIYDAHMRARAVSRLRLETDLRSALQKDEFVLHFQPIHRLADDRLYGFEALLRWYSQSRGTVGPDQFIPLAEQTGDIVPIGRWVLDAGIQQTAEWNRGVAAADPVVVNLNVSGKQVISPSFIQNITDFIKRNRLDPSQIKLEITETAVMENQAKMLEVMQFLKSDGLRFAIDDFGTGYSSLGILQKLPVDTVKIDRTFVTGLPDNDVNRSMVEMIVTLSHGLGLDVVAEGIENPEEVEFLRSLGCDFGQGYFFSMPVPVDEATALIERDRAPARAKKTAVNG